MGKILNSKKFTNTKQAHDIFSKKHDRSNNKINNPPLDEEQQKGPRKFCYFASLPSNNSRKRRKKNKTPFMNTQRFLEKNIGYYPKDGKPFKALPVLKQNKEESDSSFMYRVSQATKMVLRESAFEDKYKLDVLRDDQGNIERLQPRITKEFKERMERKRLKRKAWKLKKKGKCKGRPNELIAGQESGKHDTTDQQEKLLFKQEHIPFGETVAHPPKLSVEKLQKKLIEKKQVKIKNFLLRQELMSKKSLNDEGNSLKSDAETLEAERKRAVFAYRQLKARKLYSSNL